MLLCLLLPLLTTYTWLQWEKHQMKRQLKWKMIAGIDRKELCTLHFSVAEAKELLRWEHSREFEYAGFMYDIVEKEERADSVFYICWPDNEETALNLQLQEILKDAFGRSPAQREGKARVFRFLDSLYFISSDSIHAPERDLPSLLALRDPGGTYHSPIFSPPSPPPKGP